MHGAACVGDLKSPRAELRRDAAPLDSLGVPSVAAPAAPCPGGAGVAGAGCRGRSRGRGAARSGGCSARLCRCGHGRGNAPRAPGVPCSPRGSVAARRRACSRARRSGVTTRERSRNELARAAASAPRRWAASVSEQLQPPVLSEASFPLALSTQEDDCHIIVGGARSPFGCCVPWHAASKLF